MPRVAIHHPLPAILRVGFSLTIALIYIAILASYPEKNNLVLLFTNFAIVAYSFWRAFYKQRYGYSLYQFFYIFSLLFLGIAPLVQYKQSVQSVVGYDIRDSTYITVNLVLISVFICIDLVYRFRHRSAPTKSNIKKVPQSTRLKDTTLLKIVLLLLSLCSLSYAIYINQHDLAGLFFRDDLIERTEIESVSVGIILDIVRPLSVFAFLYYYVVGKSKLFKVILFVIAFIACSPLGLSRFRMGAYWIPVILTVFSSLSRKNLLGYIYTLGMLVVFPMLEVVRMLSSHIERGNLLGSFGDKISGAFTSMAYDSYQSLAFVMQNSFITWGQQLTGVIGFLVPRSLWEGKPIGTGFTIADIYNLGSSNISMNYFGEGYANFGFIGVVVFAIFLAIFMRLMDYRYWSAKGRFTLFMVIYMIVLGIFTYILRGDLMGSTTSTVVAVLSASVVYAAALFASRFDFNRLRSSIQKEVS